MQIYHEKLWCCEKVMLVGKRKTIYDVAEEAGVSISTVSRTINSKGYVSDEVRKRVELACKDYRPMASAREIQTQKSNTIAILIKHDINYVFMNSIFLNVLNAITTEAKRKGYRILLDAGEEDEGIYNQYLERRVDGYIVLGSKKSSYITEVFKENNVPFVLIGDCEDGQSDICQVEINDRESVYDAVNYLLRLGHEKVGIITGSLDYASARNRLNGYLQALDEAGIQRKEEYIECCDNMSELKSENLTKKMLFLKEPITALIAFNDSVAVAAMKAAVSLNINIPEDLSVIGFDDSMMASYVRPSLTTIWQPSYEKGELAINKLITALESGTIPHGREELQCMMVYRESCQSIQ